MKKVKIMLMSIALVGVVGGALAFKAKYSTDYCTAATVSGKACTELACPNQSLGKQPAGSGTKICTTTFNTGCQANCTTTSTFPLIGD